MRGYLIDPDKQRVEDVETSASLAEMYRLLSRPGAPKVDDINSVRISPDDYLWVDGEGFLKPDIPVFRLNGYDYPLAGRGLVLGIDRTGENQDASAAINAAWFLANISWTTKLSAGKLTEAREVAPGHFHIGSPILKDL